MFPSEDNHDPKSHFSEGKELMWYQFMSSSGAKSETDIQKVMHRKNFCGVDPGPRTIFTVKVTRAYEIHKFSFFQGAEGEHEVLFRPISTFKVVHAQKNILDPKKLWVENATGVNREAAYKASLDKSGWPDAVLLLHVCDDEEGKLQGTIEAQESAVETKPFLARIHCAVQSWQIPHPAMKRAPRGRIDGGIFPAFG